MPSLRHSLWLVAALVPACGGSNGDSIFSEPDGAIEDASTNDAVAADTSPSEVSADTAIDTNTSDVVSVDSSCAAGTTGREACGKCGERVRVCNSSSVWSEWSACSGETGQCVAGTKEEEACGVGGVRSRTCSAACTWSAFSACMGGTTPCTSGAVEEMVCGNCGKQLRVCGSDMKWSDWSTCSNEGACAVGAKQEEVCAGTGKRVRTCTSACTWGAFGVCAGGSGPTEIWAAVAAPSTVSGASAVGASIERISIATDAVLSTIMLPTVASGLHRPFTFSSDASFGEGQIVRRPDLTGVTLIGYDTTVGATDPGASSTIPRVIAQIDGAGAVDTRVFSNALGTMNVRAATTDDGARFWVGSPSGLSKIDASNPAVRTEIGNFTTRWVEIIGGSLYITDSNGAVSAFSGLPLVAAMPTPVFDSTANTYSMAAFAIGGSAIDRIYVASTTGIEHWSKNGTTWTRVKVIPGADRHVAGFVSGTNVVLYATRGTTLVSFVDDGGVLVPTARTVRTLPAGTYRGVSLGPQ